MTTHRFDQRPAIKSVAIMFACCFTADQSSAGLIFLGPTPYLSAADSPFPVDGSNPNFFLDDFEDGELNTPGIYQPFDPVSHGSIIHPSALTDSVDADDGEIDGNGNNGHSMAANMFITFPLDPPITWSFVRFGFDEEQLGRLPNAFGFTWTDGIAPNKVRIELFGSEWEELGQAEFAGLGDDSLAGETAEDRFIGVITHTTSIAFVQITAIYPGTPRTFELDHVQYGILIIPEPSGVALILAYLMTLQIFSALGRLRATHAVFQRNYYHFRRTNDGPSRKDAETQISRI